MPNIGEDSPGSQTVSLLARSISTLLLLGMTAIASGESMPLMDETPGFLGAKPATRAMATVEFFAGDSLQAAIEVVSVEFGEAGNGLEIGFSEADLSGFGANVVLRSEEPKRYVVELDTSVSVLYFDIVAAIEGIREVSASLSAPPSEYFYVAQEQEPPSAVTLAGGADAVVPEPGTIVLVFAASMVATSRWRSS